MNLDVKAKFDDISITMDICILLLVCKPILQAKWSNKQKTKVLCMKVHFVHFYPSNECCVKRHSFFPQLVCVYCVCVCVCVFYFFHTHQSPKLKTFFFFWGWVGTSFAREIDDNILAFNSIYPTTTFPQVTKFFWKKILNIQENSIWLKWFFKWFIYLFEKHFLKLATKVCSFFLNYSIIWQTLVQPAKVLQYMILLLDARKPHTTPPPPPPPPPKQFGGYPRKNLPIQSSFKKKWG